MEKKRQKFGGRKAGTPNKANADIKAAAALHGPAALAALVNIATDEEKPAAARVGAAVALLDRGFGKPAQSLEHTGVNGGPLQSVSMTAAEFRAVAQEVASKV